MKQALYDIGFSEGQIAEALDIPESSVKGWTTQEGLGKEGREAEPTSRGVLETTLTILDHLQADLETTNRQLDGFRQALGETIREDWERLDLTRDELAALAPVFESYVKVFRGLREATVRSEGSGRIRSKVQEHADLQGSDAERESIGRMLEVLADHGIAEQTGRTWRLAALHRSSSGGKQDAWHVTTRSEGGWKVKRVGASRASGFYDTKQEAVEAAKGFARNTEEGRVVIHRRDGSIQKSVSPK